MSTVTITLPASEPLALPFAPDLHVRSFLLEREAGNVLVYAGAPFSAAHPGTPVARQYLNHHHEAWAGTVEGRDVPLLVHRADEAPTERHAAVAHTFTRRHHVGGDLEVIPAPGHTPGATVYLWDDGARRHLFTGDTIYLRDGEWRTAVLGSSDRAAYLETLALIRTLDFDVLVPWAAGAGEEPYALTDRADTERRIDRLIERVRRGRG